MQGGYEGGNGPPKGWGGGGWGVTTTGDGARGGWAVKASNEGSDRATGGGADRVVAARCAGKGGAGGAG